MGTMPQATTIFSILLFHAFLDVHHQSQGVFFHVCSHLSLCLLVYFHQIFHLLVFHLLVFHLLVFHLLVRTGAGEGGSGTPGWYLHILAPVVGIAVAWGFQGSRLALGLSLATLLFTVMAWTLQLSMFSGCAAKLGTNKNYSFEGATCFIQVSQLQALGYPMLGGFALVLGLGFGGYAVFRAWQQR